MDRVVIGEAVELDVRPARLPSRAIAFGIDAAIMGVVLVIALVVISIAGSRFDGALAAAVSLIVFVGVLVGYPLLWETLSRGRSPGLAAMGLRVVRDDGGPIVFRHALARALAGLFVDFGFLSLFTGLIGVVVSASSARGKRVGDLLAGTVVVRERVPGAGRGALPPAPPALAAWATGCELAGLPDDLALTGRQFLVRARELAPTVRASLGERLAADVAARVAPPPPPGTPPEMYLLAVLGERRRRETMRLAGPGPVPPPQLPQQQYAQRRPAPPPPPPRAPGPPPAPAPAPTPTPAEPAASPTASGFAPPG